MTGRFNNVHSEKLKSISEKLDDIIEVIRVDYYNPITEDANLYYFYYNQNSDPCVVSCAPGEKITEDSIAISLPSSVHLDLDFRPNSNITEGELSQVIQAYKILTENVLRKNIKDGKVIRKRVTTIKKPKVIHPLINTAKRKKAGFLAQTAMAKVKRNRSNNVRDLLNLDKQPKKDISVLENKEHTMQRQDMNRRFNRINETYCTYPQARSIAVNIVDALYRHKIDGYSIKYPQTALGQVDQRGFSINYGMSNRRWVAREALEDAIAKDIMGRFARGEELDPKVQEQIALGK